LGPIFYRIFSYRKLKTTKSSFILIIMFDQTYQISEKESKPWIQSFQINNISVKSLQL